MTSLQQQGQSLWKNSSTSLTPTSNNDVFPKGRHSAEDQPVLTQKMDKGEAQWDILKEVLGWLYDGKDKTIRLPNKKVNKITAVIKGKL